MAVLPFDLKDSDSGVVGVALDGWGSEGCESLEEVLGVLGRPSVAELDPVVEAVDLPLSFS